ncbi:MAG: hypothetical protein U0Z44_03210 [Kouleothrix sp.]
MAHTARTVDQLGQRCAPMRQGVPAVVPAGHCCAAIIWRRRWPSSIKAV